MKKLMIAALAVAMGGVVYASCGFDCAYAYRVKLAGKTVKAKTAISRAATECSVEESDCWAKPASYRLAGYIYGTTTETEAADCGCTTCECYSFADGTFTDVFWNENKVEQLFDAKFDLFEVLRNSGAKNKAQVAITLEGDAGKLTLAGFGVFNPDTHKMKSASGFFAGLLTAPACEKGDCTIVTTAAKIYLPCLDDGKWVVAASDNAIAYGRWSMAYKGDKVADYEKTGNEKVFLPSAFKAVEGGTDIGEDDND